MFEVLKPITLQLTTTFDTLRASDMQKEKTTPLDTNIGFLADERHLHSVDALGNYDRLQRLLNLIEETNFRSLNQLSPGSSINHYVLILSKQIGETAGKIAYKLTTQQQDEDLFTGFTDKIEQLIRILEQMKVFDKSVTQKMVHRFATGLAELIFESDELIVGDQFVESLTNKILEKTGLSNMIVALCVSGLPPNVWLESLPNKSKIELQRVVSEEIEKLAQRKNKWNEPVRKWFMTLAAIIIHRITQGDFALVSTNALLSDEETSARDLQLLARKRVIESLTANKATAQAWFPIMNYYEQQAPANIVLAQFLLQMYDNKGIVPKSVTEDPNVMNEPSVVMYMQTIQIAQEIKKFLEPFIQAKVHWTARDQSPVIGLVETAQGWERSTRSLLENSGTIHYLLFGHSKGETSTYIRAFSSLSGLLPLLQVDSGQYYLASAKAFLEIIQGKLRHTLQVLDTLQFEDEQLQSQWAQWYASFRGKVEAGSRGIFTEENSQPSQELNDFSDFGEDEGEGRKDYSAAANK